MSTREAGPQMSANTDERSAVNTALLCCFVSLLPLTYFELERVQLLLMLLLMRLSLHTALVSLRQLLVALFRPFTIT